MRFPLEPLFAEAERQIRRNNGRVADRFGPPSEQHAPASAVELAELFGVTRRTIVRWRARAHINTTTADRCAIALGTHPALLWPHFNHHEPDD